MDKEKEKEKKPPQWKYTVEITQMCLTFGEPNLSEDCAQAIEEIVRVQLSDMIVQARSQAIRRGARYIALEDLFFLIRNDRYKLSRVRAYLSWKDARRGIKEIQAEDTDHSMNNITEEPTSDNALTVDKLNIPLGWDVMHVFSEHLDYSLDAEDDDELETFEESKDRLKEADDRTRNLTGDQYTLYSEARHASFTYRKAKRFRDFLNLGPFLDGTPNDEVLDVLGFLAYELVRTVVVAAREVHDLQARAQTAAQNADALQAAKREQSRARAKRKEREKSTGGLIKDSGTPNDIDEGSSSKRARMRSPPHVLVAPTSLFSEPVEAKPDVAPAEDDTALKLLNSTVVPSLTSGASAENHSLQASDVVGCQAMLNVEVALKTRGMKNWSGGLKRN